MAIKLKLKKFELGSVLPYGWAPYPGTLPETMGHEFTMVATFEFESSFFGKNVLFDLPRLNWREKEMWWELGGDGAWAYLGETDKGDLYTSAPNSPTWGGFAQNINDIRGHGWIYEPGSPIGSAVRSRLLNPAQQLEISNMTQELATLGRTKKLIDLELLEKKQGKYNEARIAMAWARIEHFAQRHQPALCSALDRPGMALGGGSGRSGGGFVSKTTSRSRRRVLQFDLGIAGLPQRFTATQVLETQDAKPSISKFIIPGQSDDWCKAIPDDRLAYWRSKLNPDDSSDQDTKLEPQSVIDDYMKTNTPWVHGVVDEAVRPRSRWVNGVIPTPGS